MFLATGDSLTRSHVGAMLMKKRKRARFAHIYSRQGRSNLHDRISILASPAACTAAVSSSLSEWLHLYRRESTWENPRIIRIYISTNVLRVTLVVRITLRDKLTIFGTIYKLSQNINEIKINGCALNLRVSIKCYVSVHRDKNFYFCYNMLAMTQLFICKLDAEIINAILNGDNNFVDFFLKYHDMNRENS